MIGRAPKDARARLTTVHAKENIAPPP